MRRQASVREACGVSEGDSTRAAYTMKDKQNEQTSSRSSTSGTYHHIKRFCGRGRDRGRHNRVRASSEHKDEKGQHNLGRNHG
jgi:hypothetical protein